VQYVSANLTLPGLAGETKVLERSGVRIGILALTSPRCFDPRMIPVPDGVVIEDPFAAAERLLPGLAERSDALVCLFHGPLEDARMLAQRFPSLDAVICGHEGISLQAPERVGKTWLLAAGRNGEWVGRLTLQLGEDGKPAAGDAQLIAMDDQIADNPEVAAIIAEYQAGVQGSLRAQLATEARDPLSDPLACAECHKAEYDQWATTPHAAAAETLRKLDREFDPACWECHSSEPLAAGSARVPDVTCVSCHRVEDARPDGHGTVAPVDVASCLQCHTEGKSPHFSDEAYRPMVVHE
jgi:2',3'-cyclic-nucleotide 2'-phosphodiesterase (5'-nucleotidase family)